MKSTTATTTIITIDGDMLDQLVFAHYGHTSGRVIEQVLDDNPGLANHGPILPANVQIRLPEILTAKKEGVRLWD